MKISLFLKLEVLAILGLSVRLRSIQNMSMLPQRSMSLVQLFRCFSFINGYKYFITQMLPVIFSVSILYSIHSVIENTVLLENNEKIGACDVLKTIFLLYTH